MRSKDVIAVVASDLHFRSTPPPCRSAEKNWFEAMLRPLREVCEVTEYCNAPFLIAGDVLDSWRASPELLNYLLPEFPKITYAIPGQHDLPYHDITQVDKSGFLTLDNSGCFSALPPGPNYWPYMDHSSGHTFTMYAFPWGVEIRHPTENTGKGYRIAIIHKYCWIKNHNYPGADGKDQLQHLQRELTGYDFAVFGDNHIGFITKCGGCSVINCGSFHRSKADQIKYKPFIGLLMTDGSIIQYFLDTSQDVFVTPQGGVLVDDPLVDGSDMIKELSEMKDGGLDFQEFVRRKAKNESKEVTEEIETILEGYKGI